MPPDEQSEISAHDVQYDLAFVALVLLDAAALDTKVPENRLQCLNCGVRDLVELFVRELLRRANCAVRRREALLVRLLGLHSSARLAKGVQ